MVEKLLCRPKSLLVLAGPALLLLFPSAAQAHVKWFCGPIDEMLPPLPVREVLNPLFLSVLPGFVAFVVVGAMLDALAARYVRHPPVQIHRAEIACDVIVRVGLAAYALCLWRGVALVMWADPSNRAVLTPDLYGADWLVGYLQLGIAISVMIPRTSLLAAAGLLILYALGVRQAGAFYMIDYLFFPGLAVYVGLGDKLFRDSGAVQRWRVPILIGSLSLSLMWTAVEKFLFPQWTIAVLLLHPGVTAGFSFPTVATIAGFVEFSLAFYLLAGREVLGRVGAILLAIVFVAAMPEFGILDVVGHIPILVILLVALTTGETPLQVALRRDRSAVLGSGWVVAQAYLAVLAILVALYYGLHAASVSV